MKISSQRVGFITHGRQRRTAARILYGSTALAVTAASLMIPLASPGLFGGVVAGLLGAGASGVVLLGSRRAAAYRSPGSVELSANAVTASFAGQTKTIPLVEISDGWSEPTGVVNLRLQSGEVLTFDAGSLELAERVLEHAGVDGSRRTLRVPLTSAAATISGGVPLASVGVAGVGCASLFWLMVLSVGVMKVLERTESTAWAGMFVFVPVLLGSSLLLLWLVRTLLRPHAVVGADGIRIETPSKTTFVPYTDVTAVRMDPHGVVLDRSRGAPLLLRTTKAGDRPLPTGDVVPAPDSSEPALRQRVLFDRIVSVANESAPPASVDALDRNGKSLDAWRAQLKTLVEKGGGYRSQALSREILHDLLSNGAAPPERRIAVAMALADAGDADDKQRIRIAIDTCADENLKAALEQAAEGELQEAAIEHAIRARQVDGPSRS